MATSAPWRSPESNRRAYAIYLDGALLGSGTGLATGFTFQSGGQFGLGVDLDSGTDSWQPGALFQGTFKDVRIFSDVRTAAEIAASYRSELPYNEGNMIAIGDSRICQPKAARPTPSATMHCKFEA